MIKINPILMVADCKLDFLDCSMDILDLALNGPDAQRMVSIRCRYCDEPLECRYGMAPFVSCDRCIKAELYRRKIEHYREYWEDLCPTQYRETNIQHEGFPRAIWADVEKQDKAEPFQSYFLYGPSGMGKSRVAFLLLKAALLRGHRVGVLWPEKISTLKTRYDSAALDQYAAYDTLLFEDSLLTCCKDGDMVDSIKMLIDIRMREKRPIIMTSQIGEAGVQDGKQYGEVKSADIERIAALMRRLRETCSVVPFVKATPTEGENVF